MDPPMATRKNLLVNRPILSTLSVLLQFSALNIYKKKKTLEKKKKGKGEEEKRKEKRGWEEGGCT